MLSNINLPAAQLFMDAQMDESIMETPGFEDNLADGIYCYTLAAQVCASLALYSFGANQ
jgi:hypothetical protein